MVYRERSEPKLRESTKRRNLTAMQPSVVEICAGGGGQALGLEQAGFELAAAIEIDEAACETLRINRPQWTVIQGDVRTISGRRFRGTTLLAGGVPCPPFSIAGKQNGRDDKRDLFPAALRLVREIKPQAVLLENVRGFATRRFDSYRDELMRELAMLGLESDWHVLNARDFGVPQLRRRWVLVALRPEAMAKFTWPVGERRAPTVGKTLLPLMSSRKWPGAAEWAEKADLPAPTIVGGSKKHGGPDLGPTRAKRAWADLAVDGMGIANAPPGREFPADGMPRLTTEMVSLVQGFPAEWRFAGLKTAAYRQVGNAFPPPVARAVGESLLAAFRASSHG